jgi:hypothetical protein
LAVHRVYRSADPLAIISGVVAVPLIVIIMLEGTESSVDEFAPTVCALL